jgi:hypothetical protein
MGNKFINPGHPVCECGTNVDAFEAALRLARQAFKVDEYGEVCPLWATQVAESFEYIIYQFALARAHRQVERNPDQFTGVTRQEVHDAAGQWMTDAAALVIAAMVHNERLNKDLAKFVCEEINGGNAERDVIEKGPSPKVLESIGLQVQYAKVNMDPILAKVLFGVEIDGPGGSKPH